MKSIALAAALAGIVLCSSAHAQSGEQTKSVTVRYADLNLSDPAGAKVMLGRIKRAVETVCGGEPDLRELGQMQAFRGCERESIHHALDVLDAPQVTALYKARGELVFANLR